jgi:hypothetical protein
MISLDCADGSLHGQTGVTNSDVGATAVVLTVAPSPRHSSFQLLFLPRTGVTSCFVPTLLQVFKSVGHLNNSFYAKSTKY